MLYSHNIGATFSFSFSHQDLKDKMKNDKKSRSHGDVTHLKTLSSRFISHKHIDTHTEPISSIQTHLGDIKRGEGGILYIHVLYIL